MPPRKKDAEPGTAIYVAQSTGTMRVKGTRYTYISGKTMLPADHPLVKALPSRFAPLVVPGTRGNRVVIEHPVEVTPPEVAAQAPEASEV